MVLAVLLVIDPVFSKIVPAVVDFETQGYTSGKEISDSPTAFVSSEDDEVVQTPAGKVVIFAADGSSTAAEGEDAQPVLYDAATDTIFIYNPYQIDALVSDDAASHPVMSQDWDAAHFGMGQVAKEIDGETYILIGNAQQLRAIGSDNKVRTAVYQTYKKSGDLHLDEGKDGKPIMLYSGDADLEKSQNGYADFTFGEVNDASSNLSGLTLVKIRRHPFSISFLVSVWAI